MKPSKEGAVYKGNDMGGRGGRSRTNPPTLAPVNEDDGTRREHGETAGAAGNATNTHPHRKSRARSSGLPPQFPRLLFTMLSNAEEGGYSNIVSWLPHGMSFVIGDREKFVTKILPLYFKQTRFTSFQRQLNLYAFMQVSRKGPDHKSYYHEKFRRDQPHLVETISRVQVGTRGSSNYTNWVPKPDPDFTGMFLRMQRNATAAARKSPGVQEEGAAGSDGDGPNNSISTKTPPRQIQAAQRASGVLPAPPESPPDNDGQEVALDGGAADTAGDSPRNRHVVVEEGRSVNDAAPDNYMQLPLLAQQNPESQNSALVLSPSVEGRLNELEGMANFLEGVDLNSRTPRSSSDEQK